MPTPIFPIRQYPYLSPPFVAVVQSRYGSEFRRSHVRVAFAVDDNFQWVQVEPECVVSEDGRTGTFADALRFSTLKAAEPYHMRGWPGEKWFGYHTDLMSVRDVEQCLEDYEEYKRAEEHHEKVCHRVNISPRGQRYRAMLDEVYGEEFSDLREIQWLRSEGLTWKQVRSAMGGAPLKFNEYSALRPFSDTLHDHRRDEKRLRRLACEDRMYQAQREAAYRREQEDIAARVLRGVNLFERKGTGVVRVKEIRDTLIEDGFISAAAWEETVTAGEMRKRDPSVSDKIKAATRRIAEERKRLRLLKRAQKVLTR